jgi:3D (Asp-Asp-Asp) domain-containing protein
MPLSRSLRRKVLAVLLTGAAVGLLYRATIYDSLRSATARLAGQGGGSRVEFVATAYCRGLTTASGVTVQSGIAAADPGLLPEGSVVQLDEAPEGHGGIYTVLDTGPKVQGRHVDLYMWNCTEARQFGRRPVKLTVLRLGWNPKNTAPAMKAARKGD